MRFINEKDIFSDVNEMSSLIAVETGNRNILLYLGILYCYRISFYLSIILGDGILGIQNFIINRCQLVPSEVPAGYNISNPIRKI